MKKSLQPPASSLRPSSPGSSMLDPGDHLEPGAGSRKPEAAATVSAPSLRLFRVVSAEDVAAGRFESGPLVYAESEDKARETYEAPGAPMHILSSDVLVEQMTAEERHRLRLDAHYQRRWRALEEREEKRCAEARQRFIAELTGEAP